MAWDNAERIVEVIDQGIASGELTDDEVAQARESLERARAVAEHKRTLDNL
jgi:sRNA-binding protein